MQRNAVGKAKRKRRGSEVFPAWGVVYSDSGVFGVLFECKKWGLKKKKKEKHCLSCAGEGEKKDHNKQNKIKEHPHEKQKDEPFQKGRAKTMKKRTTHLGMLIFNIVGGEKKCLNISKTPEVDVVKGCDDDDTMKDAGGEDKGSSFGG